jgi:hypothetical protein
MPCNKIGFPFFSLLGYMSFKTSHTHTFFLIKFYQVTSFALARLKPINNIVNASYYQKFILLTIPKLKDTLSGPMVTVLSVYYIQSNGIIQIMVVYTFLRQSKPDIFPLVIYFC